MSVTTLKTVLVKYMRHVLQCEGSDYLDSIGCAFAGTEVSFTPEEMAVLKEVAVLARNENPPTPK